MTSGTATRKARKAAEMLSVDVMKMQEDLDALERDTNKKVSDAKREFAVENSKLTNKLNNFVENARRDHLRKRKALLEDAGVKIVH